MAPLPTTRFCGACATRARRSRCFAAEGGWTGAGCKPIDVIAPPPGELFPETNDNSVAILLSYGRARVMLAGDAEAGEEYMAGGSYTRP